MDSDLKYKRQSLLQGLGLSESLLPNHIGIIMDGNGRWARKNSMSRINGHKSAIKSVREITTASAELGIKVLTLFAFSKENWTRPKREIQGLFSLLALTLEGELPNLKKEHIQLNVIGKWEDLPKKIKNKLAIAIESTAHYQRMKLCIALNYSGKWDITQGCQHLIDDALLSFHKVYTITEHDVQEKLVTASFPEVDLIIRTSGELRISNFFLWQAAYAELYFTDVLWPDFERHHFYKAVQDFQKRTRRFGGI